MNPVFYHNGDKDHADGWYFYDDLSQMIGPYATQSEGMQAYTDYFANPEYDF
jgi:hypothetical protein